MALWGCICKESPPSSKTNPSGHLCSTYPFYLAPLCLQLCSSPLHLITPSIYLSPFSPQASVSVSIHLYRFLPTNPHPHLYSCSVLYWAATAWVSPPEVTSSMRLPEDGRFTPVAQLKNISAIYSSGVQVLKSALGMNFLFIGVSKVTGSIATAAVSAGIPLFFAARLWHSWWTAALAMPYPIMPPVPDWAALAPARVSSPPVFRCKAARWLEMVEVHTLCFHIKSAFLYKSLELQFPPAHPPATHKMASTFCSPSNWATSAVTCTKWELTANTVT